MNPATRALELAGALSAASGGRQAPWLYVLSRRMRVIIAEHDVVLSAGEVAEFDTSEAGADS